jgi:predicted nucleic acid-binding protein
LAVELHADVLLIDDAKGRRTALREGLDVIGLLGVCVIAKRTGLITSLRETIDGLESDAGFYVSADLRKEMLAAVGET